MNIFANQKVQQNDFIESCGLTEQQAIEFKADPDKWLWENCPEMSGESRALLNGNADKGFWYAMIFCVGIVLPIVVGFSYYMAFVYKH